MVKMTWEIFAEYDEKLLFLSNDVMAGYVFV